MFHVLRPGDQTRGRIAAVEFEGASRGAGVSFLLGDLAPGKGPGLHRHPYPETCIIRSGQAAMLLDGQEVLAGPGDIVVIGAGVPHRFTAVGEERLVAIAIHAAERFVIDWLDG